MKIKEPRPGGAVSGSIRFNATARGHPRAVSFHVDGRRRWTDRSRPYAFGPRGVIDSSRLSPGLHHLSVKAHYRRGKRRRASVPIRVVRNGAGKTKGWLPAGSDGAPRAGSLVWVADFETGDFSQWEGVQQYNTQRASVVSSPRIEGSHAGRFEVREGEFTFGNDQDTPTRNRTEAVLSKAKGRHDPREGADWWYRWWFYLPSTTALPASSSGFIILMQHVLPTEPSVDLVGTFEFRHHHGLGDPGPKLTYGGEARGAPDPMASVGGGPFWAKPASGIERDAWHKVLLHKKWSSDPSIGFVELWFDDVRQTFRDGSARVHHANLRPGYSAYMKQGLYRTNALGGSAVVYHDGLRIGTNRESVE